MGPGETDFMRMRTRKILLRTATAAAVLCTAAVMLLPAVASAAAFGAGAKAPSDVWLPLSSPVLDILLPGEASFASGGHDISSIRVR